MAVHRSLRRLRRRSPSPCCVGAGALQRAALTIEDVTRPGDAEEIAGQMAAESIATGDPTGWFERLYAAAEAGEIAVPWDRGVPSRYLTQWAAARALVGAGKRALVVGCGLGDDAEFVARLGFQTVAFDISPTAIATARRRFPGSAVRY